jgi:hypothetical protein
LQRGLAKPEVNQVNSVATLQNRRASSTLLAVRRRLLQRADGVVGRMNTKSTADFHAGEYHITSATIIALSQPIHFH